MNWDDYFKELAEKGDKASADLLASNERAQRSYRGAQSKRVGDTFEDVIAASLVWYEGKGIVCVEKTPEPTKQLSKPDKWGRFTACYEKAAQPDFKGTLVGGRSVVFEAKHTDTGRIKYDRLSNEQVEKLSTHHALGAAAFVLVSFGLQDFFRIPWEVWRDMKAIYGRKYLLPTELEEYRVQYIAGVLKLLEGIELTYNDRKIKKSAKEQGQ